MILFGRRLSSIEPFIMQLFAILTHILRHPVSPRERHHYCTIFSMRNKDQILDDFIFNDTRVVIAKNKQHHIIRYAPSRIKNFYKKAKRVQHASLRNCVEWLSQYFGVDFKDLSLKIKQSLNRRFKALKLSRPTDTRKRREARWKNGGIQHNNQLDIFN